MTVTVLAPYPLERRFRAELEAAYGPVDVLTVPTLRRESPRTLLRRLRSVDGTVVLAVETDASESSLPALRALAALTRSSAVWIARPGLPPIEVRGRSVLRPAFEVAAASAGGLAALVATESASRRLLDSPRLPTEADLARGVVLLNSSPWVGLAAGGAVTHTTGVANALAAEEIRVSVATYAETPELRDDVGRLTLPRPRGAALPPELNRFRFGRAAGRLAADAGLVYERATLGSIAGVTLSRRLGVPLVVEYNGSEVWAARNWGGTTRFEGPATRAEVATLRHARLVVTVSQALADELERRGVASERILWHPNGVDPARFDPARIDDAARRDVRRRYGIHDDAILVTFVGTFGAWHGADVLARAARLAAARDTPAMHFLFVGDGAQAPEVARLLAGSERCATLAGTVAPAEIPAHLAASDILAAPHVANRDGTAFFGSPTKLFEYMAAGKAIVASHLDQIADVLDGVAILVRPGDEIDLLKGLDSAVADRALRRQLGERARRRAIERYTWSHHVRAILDALADSPA